MNYVKKIKQILHQLVHVFIITFVSSIQAQYNKPDTILKVKQTCIFKYKPLIAPTLFIGYGAVGLESNSLKHMNTEIRDYVVKLRKKRKLQLLPLLPIITDIKQELICFFLSDFIKL